MNKITDILPNEDNLYVVTLTDNAIILCFFKNGGFVRDDVVSWITVSEYLTRPGDVSTYHF